jgi:PAS domain S-box-containing protein
MKDKDKAQGQLMEELKRLRGRVSELETADAERKRAEVEAQRQEKRFQAIAENSSDVIILLDAKGTVLYESPAMEQLLGLSPKDRVGASVFERVHPEDMPAVTERFQRLLQNPDAPVQRLELRIRHKDGSWRTVEAAGSAVSHNSVVEGMVINLRDISERKKAEEALRQSEEYFRALIESSLDVISVVDAKGTVLYQSPNKCVGTVSIG